MWDGDRKRKPRLKTTSSAERPLAHSSSYSHPSSDPYTADPARRIDRPYSATLPARPSQQDAELDAPLHWRPSPPSTWNREGANDANARTSRHAADLYDRPRYPSSSATNTTYPAPYPPQPAAQPRPPVSTASVPTHASSTTDGQYDAALFISPYVPDSAHTKVTGHQFPLLTNRFMHSPLFTLNRFITKIPSFSRLLRPEMDRSLDSDLSSLLSNENIHQLQAHLPRLRMWHPHLADLDSLCIAFHERNKPSTSLLLATVCLVTSKLAGKRHLAKQFATHVDRIGLQVLVSAPKEFHAAQAFELLLSHEPSLIGASVDPSGEGTASTDSAVFGQSLHSSAISIAEAIGLDHAMSQASQNDANPAQPRSQDQDRVRSDLRRFSLWCSLSIWRAKFIFLNSVLRPLDFSRLRRDAELAIQLVETLPQQARSTTNDDVLFRAGVLALAYRAIQLADFHTRLSQLDTLWNSRSLFSEVEVRNEIRSRMDQNLAFVQELERTKRRKLWGMANLAELRFLDRWIDLESGSDGVFLYTLCMRMVLPIPSTKAAVTVLDISHSLDRDAGLYRFLFDVSQRSFLNDERVIAGFAATARFEGDTLEQTGLPLLLTCGYILHISTCVIEAAGFAQYGSHDLAMRVDMFAHLLPRLADRICGPERAKVESLETLVSSMLMQMARRLDELEFYKVTQKIKQPPSASTAQLASGAHATNGPHRHRSSSHLDPSAPLSNRAREGSPQRHATPSSEPSTIHYTHTSSTIWQDTSDIAQSEQSRPAPAGVIGSHSSHLHSHVADGSMGSNNGQVSAAASFPTHTDSLLSSSDAWSSDNMARIMDQILSWDYMPDVTPTTNGSSA